MDGRGRAPYAPEETRGGGDMNEGREGPGVGPSQGRRPGVSGAGPVMGSQNMASHNPGRSVALEPAVSTAAKKPVWIPLSGSWGSRSSLNTTAQGSLVKAKT